MTNNNMTDTSNIMHVFYTLSGKYIQGTKDDYIANAIEGGYTFFKGYSTHNRPKMNLANVVKEVQHSIYDGTKYDAIQLYKERCISTNGRTAYIKDELIELN